MKAWTKEMFLEQFNSLNQNNNFEINIDDFKNNTRPIDFKCTKCGKIFKRKPTVFIYTNKTCPYCNGKQRNKKYSTHEFIEIANNLHNNKYDYTKTKYIHTDSKICVICHEKDEFNKEHGEFYVTPHSHIGKFKVGCPKCSNKYGSNDRFINLANKTHNNKYDYSKVEYFNAKTKVCIICPTHGDFYQTPNGHLSGKGCPKCKQSHLENSTMQILAENDIKFEYQKRFKWLGKQSLDFYLPEYNIAIECQGEQHFKFCKYFHKTNENFKKSQQLDVIKKKLCDKNGIKLFEIINKEDLLNIIKSFENTKK